MGAAVKPRKTIPAEVTRYVCLHSPAYIDVHASSLVSALVEVVGEGNVGYFPEVWANGDGLEVRFKRVRATKKRVRGSS